MTHPTDDKLEAMALKIWREHVAICQMIGVDPKTTVTPAIKAAAMLRECKGRVKPLPRTDGEGGWTLPVELLAEIRDEVYANEWDAPCAEVIEIIALSVERRILSALDPAPDHSDWNAAIEAAAKVAREMANSEANMSPTWRAGCSDCHDALSQLKKGQTND